MGGHRVFGSFDLFPQHCLFPALNPMQHVEAVHKELRESIMALPKKIQAAPAKSHYQVTGNNLNGSATTI